MTLRRPSRIIPRARGNISNVLTGLRALRLRHTAQRQSRRARQVVLDVNIAVQDLRNDMSQDQPLLIDDDEDLPTGRQQIRRLDQATASSSRLIGRNERIEQAPAQCPFYYDHKLRLLMWRGPGYEEFPVAVDSDPTLRELVKEWEEERAQALRRRSRQSSLRVTTNATQPIAGSPSNTSEFDSEDADKLMPLGRSYNDFEDSTIAQALQIFPTIDTKFVRQKCQEWLALVDPEVVAFDLDPSAEVIQKIADLETFPEQSNKRKRSAERLQTSGNIEYGQNTGAEQKSELYIYDAIRLLADEFPHVPSFVMWNKLKEGSSLWATYRFVENCERTYQSTQPKPYRRVRNPRVELELKYMPRNSSLPRHEREYPFLVNELQAVKKACCEESRQAKRQKEDEDTEMMNFRVHADSGMLVQCQCCFDDEVPINRAVPCDGDEIHFYCYGCVKQQVASQIGQMKWKMNCMFSGAKDCIEPLSNSLIRAIIDEKSLAKLDEYQCKAEIAEANIEDLEECPFCEFKASCEPKEVDREFRCCNDKCLKTSCRHCREMTHVPKTCEQAKKDRGTTLRHDVEEAMSDALIRKCPKCKMPIIKEYGCNKMFCTNCSTVMCYVCCKDLTSERGGGGYAHFSREGATCPLQDDRQDQTDELQVEQAQQATIRRLREEHPDVDEETLQVPKGPESTRAPMFPNHHPPLPPELQLRRVALEREVLRREQDRLNNIRVGIVDPNAPNPGLGQAYDPQAVVRNVPQHLNEMRGRFAALRQRYGVGNNAIHNNGVGNVPRGRFELDHGALPPPEHLRELEFLLLPQLPPAMPFADVQGEQRVGIMVDRRQPENRVGLPAGVIRQGPVQQPQLHLRPGPLHRRPGGQQPNFGNTGLDGNVDLDFPFVPNYQPGNAIGQAAAPYRPLRLGRPPVNDYVPLAIGAGIAAGGIQFAAPPPAMPDLTDFNNVDGLDFDYDDFFLNENDNELMGR